MVKKAETGGSGLWIKIKFGMMHQDMTTAFCHRCHRPTGIIYHLSKHT